MTDYNSVDDAHSVKMADHVSSHPFFYPENSRTNNEWLTACYV